MKDFNIQSCQWMSSIAFASPHKITNVSYVKNIYNLFLLAEYQCKGLVKFNLSDLFFRGQFSEVLKTIEFKK